MVKDVARGGVFSCSLIYCVIMNRGGELLDYGGIRKGECAMPDRETILIEETLRLYARIAQCQKDKAGSVVTIVANAMICLMLTILWLRVLFIPGGEQISGLMMVVLIVESCVLIGIVAYKTYSAVRDFLWLSSKVRAYEHLISILLEAVLLSQDMDGEEMIGVDDVASVVDSIRILE